MNPRFENYKLYSILDELHTISSESSDLVAGVRRGSFEELSSIRAYSTAQKLIAEEIYMISTFVERGAGDVDSIFAKVYELKGDTTVTLEEYTSRVKSLALDYFSIGDEVSLITIDDVLNNNIPDGYSPDDIIERFQSVASENYANRLLNALSIDTIIESATTIDFDTAPVEEIISNQREYFNSMVNTVKTHLNSGLMTEFNEELSSKIEVYRNNYSASIDRIFTSIKGVKNMVKTNVQDLIGQVTAFEAKVTNAAILNLDQLAEDGDLVGQLNSISPTIDGIWDSALGGSIVSMDTPLEVWYKAAADVLENVFTFLWSGLTSSLDVVRKSLLAINNALLEVRADANVAKIVQAVYNIDGVVWISKKPFSLAYPALPSPFFKFSMDYAEFLAFGPDIYDTVKSDISFLTSFGDLSSIYLPKLKSLVTLLANNVGDSFSITHSDYITLIEHRDNDSILFTSFNKCETTTHTVIPFFSAESKLVNTFNTHPSFTYDDPRTEEIEEIDPLALTTISNIADTDGTVLSFAFPQRRRLLTPGTRFNPIYKIFRHSTISYDDEANYLINADNLFVSSLPNRVNGLMSMIVNNVTEQMEYVEPISYLLHVVDSDVVDVNPISWNQEYVPSYWALLDTFKGRSVLKRKTDDVEASIDDILQGYNEVVSCSEVPKFAYDLVGLLYSKVTLNAFDPLSETMVKETFYRYSGGENRVYVRVPVYSYINAGSVDVGSFNDLRDLVNMEDTLILTGYKYYKISVELVYTPDMSPFYYNDYTFEIVFRQDSALNPTVVNLYKYTIQQIEDLGDDTLNSQINFGGGTSLFRVSDYEDVYSLERCVGVQVPVGVIITKKKIDAATGVQYGANMMDYMYFADRSAVTCSDSDKLIFILYTLKSALMQSPYGAVTPVPDFIYKLSTDTDKLISYGNLVVKPIMKSIFIKLAIIGVAFSFLPAMRALTKIVPSIFKSVLTARKRRKLNALITAQTDSVIEGLGDDLSEITDAIDLGNTKVINTLKKNIVKN